MRTKKELSIAFSQKLPKYFHKHEIDAILEAVKGKDSYTLLINLLWQTGARVSEILAIKVKDIDFHTKTLRITTLKQKNHPQRAIPLQGNLLGQLGAYMALKQLGKEVSYLI